MIQGENYCISKENIAVHELIGLKAAIKNSPDAGKIGLQGKIVNETKNTLVIETRNSLRTIPKEEALLEISLGKEKVLVNGSRIAFRPEDRTKKLWRKKNAI